MTSDVRLRFEKVAVVHVGVLLDVTIGHDDLRAVGFNLFGVREIRQLLVIARERTKTDHEQRLAERSRSLPEHLVGVEGDDVAEGEDEGVDVFHIEVVGGDGVRNGVLGEDLRLFDGVAVRRRWKRASEKSATSQSGMGKGGSLTES